MFEGADQRMVETLEGFRRRPQFRRDLFMRDPQPLSGSDFVDALGRIRFMLAVEPGRTTTTLETAAGTVSPSDAILGPILDRLKQGSVGVGELAAMPALAGLSQPQFAQAFALLVESAQVHPALDSGAGPRDGVTRAQRGAARRSDERRPDALSRRAGPRFRGLRLAPRATVLLALREFDRTDIDAIRDFVWGQFKTQKKRLAKDGQAIQGDAENLAELERRIRGFIARAAALAAQLGRR